MSQLIEQPEIMQEAIDAVARLQETKINGRSQTVIDKLHNLQTLVRCGSIQTFEPFLPMCLTLQGSPYTLQDHFPFSPLFRVLAPQEIVYKTARQVSKSTCTASSGVLFSAAVPNFRSLYITPLFEQIRRFSNNYVRPFIERSPIRPLMIGTSTENSVLQRSFRNLSTMIFSFAALDADRLRGVSTDVISIDEIQDFNADFIPIVKESLSYSKYGLMRYTGTPKTLDNPIEGLWRDSSQAEWVIKCRTGGCNFYNIPSLDQHLDRMIGPYSQEISEKRPGVICAKCGKPIFPRDGRWLHRYKTKRWLRAGYHVPQIIMPLHYATPKKWKELLAKQQGWGNTTKANFYNEVLGESLDAGQKLITTTDLQRACTLEWHNNPKMPSQDVIQRIQHYQMRCLAVDWGGGGEKGVSFTVLSLMGFLPDGTIDVLWGKRLVSSTEHTREAREIKHWLEVFNCHFLAHDYTGAGAVRETVLVNMGYPKERIMPVAYVGAAAGQYMRFIPATITHSRDHYNLDKTRSLLYTCTAIKHRFIKFFRFDDGGEGNKGLISDFLALIENKTATRGGGDLYQIIKADSLSDDFAQAVNIGAASLWYANKAFPDFSKIDEEYVLSQEMLHAAGSSDYGWENV